MVPRPPFVSINDAQNKRGIAEMATPSTSSCSPSRRRARDSISRSSPTSIECCCCDSTTSHSSTASLAASSSSSSASYTDSVQCYSSIASTSTSTLASSTVSSNPTTVASSIEDEYPITHNDEQEDFCTPTKRSPNKRIRARSAVNSAQQPSPHSARSKHSYGDVVRRIDYQDRAEDQYSSMEQMLVRNGFSRCRVQTPQSQKVHVDDSMASDSSATSSPDGTPRAIRRRPAIQPATIAALPARTVKKRPSLFSMVTSYIYGSSDTSDDEVVFSPSSAEWTRPRATALATSGQCTKPIDIPSANHTDAQHAYATGARADGHGTQTAESSDNLPSTGCSTSYDSFSKLSNSQESATDESTPPTTPIDSLPREAEIKGDAATAAVRALRRQLERHAPQQDISQEAAYQESIDDSGAVNAAERHRMIAAAQAKHAKVARALDESVALCGQSRSLEGQNDIVTYLCTPPKPILLTPNTNDKPSLRPLGAEAMLRGALRHARSESSLRTSVRPSTSTVPVKVVRKRPSIATIFGYSTSDNTPAPIIPASHEFTLPSPPTPVAVPQPRLLRKAASMATLRRAASPILCGDEAMFANVDSMPTSSSKNPPMASSLFMPPVPAVPSNSEDVAAAALPVKQTLRAKQSLENFLVKRQEYERVEAQKRQATTEGRRALARMSSFHRPALPQVVEAHHHDEAPPHRVSEQVAAQREADQRARSPPPTWLKSVTSAITTSAMAGLKALISLSEDGQTVAEESRSSTSFSTDSWGRRGFAQFTPATMHAGFAAPATTQILRRSRSLEQPRLACSPSLVAGDKRNGRAKTFKDKETRRRERRRRMSVATANATFHHRLSSAFPNFTSDYASQSEESGDEGRSGKTYVSRTTGRTLVVPAIVVSEHSDDNDSEEDSISP